MGAAMTAGQARVRVERIMMLARGTVLQGRLWALCALCENDAVFVAALCLSPLLVNQSLKRALAHHRKRIVLADIRMVRQAQAEIWHKQYRQYRLF